ncbi:MAG: hypothetical protein JXR37_10720 [Kiritimatiellae bacterium]|nr:hypothetical protein [Kiritimatiellia bacterium]
MQPFNFEFGERYVAIGPWQIAFRVYSEFNVYTPAPDALEQKRDAGKTVITADRFAWAGLQQSMPGSFRAEIVEKGDEFELAVEAELPERIKGTTVYVRGIPKGEISVGTFRFEPLGERRNDLLQYPKVAQCRFPLVFLKHAKADYTFALSTDAEVRQKTFAAQFPGEGVLLELHHHEDARKWSTHQQTPVWQFGKTKNPPDIVARRMRLMEDQWGLEPWETRPDVPDWARRICLVLNLHGTHWTGYVYNDYARQLAIVRYVADRLGGRHVLAFCPAWDGRYNYNWPQYEPAAAMGGEAGLKGLVAGAHACGVHVIPQIGAQSANRTFLPQGLHNSAFQDAFGNPFSKDVDWDNDRMGDTYRVDATLAHPGFRQFLLDKVCSLNERFGFDGIFMDINQVFHNDSRFHITEGHLDFARRLHERFAEFLVFGESWYDGIMPAYPLTHCAKGKFAQWNEIFEKYCRVTYHLVHPAPGRGSTGVYEAGFAAPIVPDPDADVIPALAFVEDTLAGHAAEISQAIEIAKTYGKRKGII